MWLYHRVMSANDADGMANVVDADQTRSSLIWVCTVCPADQEESDLGLYCLPGHICPKTLNHYSR